MDGVVLVIADVERVDPFTIVNKWRTNWSMVFFEKECLPTPSAKSRVWEGKKKWGESIDKNITNQIEIIR